jgi:flagellar hook-length control protein FliK
MKIGSVETLELINAAKVKANNDKKQKLYSEKNDNKFETVLSSKVDKVESKPSKAEDTTTQETMVKDTSEKTKVDTENKDIDKAEEVKPESNSEAVIDVSLLLKLLQALKNQGVEKISADKLKEITGSTDTKAMNTLASLLNTLSEGLKNGESKDSLSSLLVLMKQVGDNSEVPKELILQINTLIDKTVKQPVSVENKLKALLKNTVEKLDDVSNTVGDSNKLINLSQTKIETKTNQSLEGGKEQAFKEPDFKEPDFKEPDSKEDKLLKSILSTDSKADSKIMTISNHLSRLTEATNQVSDVSEALVVNRNTMVNDVVKVVKYMNLNNLQELTVKINPKDLGEISIKLTMEGTLLKANISASNKDTYNLLNANLSDLKNGLNNQEIKVQEVAINIYNEDTTFFSNNFNNNEQQFGRHQQRNTSAKAVSAVGEVENLDLETTKLDNDNNLSVLA